MVVGVGVGVGVCELLSDLAANDVPVYLPFPWVRISLFLM